MPLREHLREFRSRLIKIAVAVSIGAVAGWFIYDPLIAALKAPLVAVAHQRDVLVDINYGEIASPFNLKLKISFLIGVAVASPIWLFQLWAFIVPGLTKREKRYALGFVAASLPLFAAGLGLAWLVLPNAIVFFAEFVPARSTQLIDADRYLTFVTQVFLAFGIAFVVPVLLVALNMVGVLSGRSLANSWRIAVFLVFLFAAIASPSPDAGSMIALAVPMVGLYLIAVAIALLNDRRRGKNDPFAGLDDDEASSLDGSGSSVDAALPVDGVQPLDDDDAPPARA
jgi:sec-independent protein translocase protein TatC